MVQVRPMQLNIYIPKEKEPLLAVLDHVANATRRSKNELVIEALERYLAAVSTPSLGRYRLGAQGAIRRKELYAERVKR